MKLYPIRSYESEAEVRVGDVVRMRHTGDLHGGISPAFDDSIVLEVDAAHAEAELARPHARIEGGRVCLLTETYRVKLSWLVDRYFALTRGLSGEVDNRDYGEPAVPGSFGTGASAIRLRLPRPGLLATLQSVGFAIVTEGTSDPRDVLARLLVALAELEPRAALAITGGALFPPTIPDEALADELHAFWSSDEATAVLGQLFRELNQAAPPGFIFAPEGDWTRLGFFREAPEQA